MNYWSVIPLRRFGAWNIVGRNCCFKNQVLEVKKLRKKMSFCIKDMITRCQAMVQDRDIVEGMGSLSTQQQEVQSKILKQ